MKKIQKNKEYVLRAKSLGTLGELLAIKALADNGFEKIRNLNDEKSNFPFGDLLTEKSNTRYLISVKSRNKYQRDGSLNSRYKLGDKCYQNAKVACEQLKAEPYWMAVQFDGRRYSVYLGSLYMLNGNKGIPMNQIHLTKYLCMVDNKEHGIDFHPYLNTYDED